jgi:hypothetical protein
LEELNKALEFSFLFEKEVLLEFWTGLKCNPDPDIVLCNLVSEVKKGNKASFRGKKKRTKLRLG